MNSRQKDERYAILKCALYDILQEANTAVSYRQRRKPNIGKMKEHSFVGLNQTKNKVNFQRMGFDVAFELYHIHT